MKGKGWGLLAWGDVDGLCYQLWERYREMSIPVYHVPNSLKIFIRVVACGIAYCRYCS